MSALLNLLARLDRAGCPARALSPRRFKGLTFYEIDMREFQQVLHRDMPPTTLWGYNGHYPGPTLMAYEHERVSVRWVNALRDAHGNYRSEHYLPVDPCSHGVHEGGSAARTVVHLHSLASPAIRKRSVNQCVPFCNHSFEY